MMIECPKCNGTGLVSLETDGPRETTICGRCGGSGKLTAADNRAIENANAELAQAEDNMLFGRDSGW